MFESVLVGGGSAVTEAELGAVFAERLPYLVVRGLRGNGKVNGGLFIVLPGMDFHVQGLGFSGGKGFDPVEASGKKVYLLCVGGRWWTYRFPGNFLDIDVESTGVEIRNLAASNRFRQTLIVN